MEAGVQIKGISICLAMGRLLDMLHQLVNLADWRLREH